MKVGLVMNILEEIKLKFSSIRPNTIIQLNTIPDEFKTFVVKTFDNYGVAIIYDKDDDVFAEFSSAKIETKIFPIKKGQEYKEIRCLYFNSSNFTLRNEFAVICKHFVDPGENGELRKKLIESPFDWWESWKSLLGNAEKNISSYSVLAELLVLKYLYQTYSNVQWTSIINGTHDFETDEFVCEVKSTIKKYDLTISINSQNQLHSNKPVYLFFCRLEKSPYGNSIDDVVRELVDLGYPANELEEQLTSLNLRKGKKMRKEKYMVVDKRKYCIDDKFPKLSIEDISNETTRNKILKIVYTIDLGGIEYTKW